ncbi:hypothetical protein H4S07_000515 [Coemansia furcata]|uniref:Uncharacterized protein n=1 Tax=Coemansia furcata TaxID=417177 RepID=A0ACC1LQ04_9FUNG|nr:hypothetical protein H4S07_000515 [Coemansia furcata]
MQTTIASLVSAVLAAAAVVSAAPLAQNNELANTNNVLEVRYNPAAVDWSKVDWSKVNWSKVDWGQIDWTAVFASGSPNAVQPPAQEPAPAPPAPSPESAPVPQPQPVVPQPPPAPVVAPPPPPAPVVPPPPPPAPVVPPPPPPAPVAHDAIVTSSVPVVIVAPPTPTPSSSSVVQVIPSTPPAPAPSTSPNTGSNNGGVSTGGRPLWGLTYSPYNTDGSCPDVSAVAAQLQKVAAATGHIRLYSTDCSQLSSVLQAITQHNIALDVYAGIWLAGGSSRMQSDLDQFVAAAKTYGTGLIKGLSVGNEDVSNGMSEVTVIGYIGQVRARLQAEGLSGIPIYTTEQDAKFSRALAAASDVVQVNIYAMFDGYYANLDASVQSVIQRANNIKNSVAGGKLVRFGETGWASAGNTGPSPLTLANEISYAQKFKCAAAAAGYEYFYFEAKDAQWKVGQVLSEQSFGIFNAGFTPKFDFGLLNSC